MAKYLPTIIAAKTRLYLASFLFLLVILPGCSKNDRQEVVFNGATMGTTYSIKYLIPKDGDQNEVALNVANLLEFIDGTMSTYQSESELNRLNDMPVGEPFRVSTPLWRLLLIAEQIYKDTGGAFDPTVGPLVDLWGFGPVDTQDKIPSSIEIAALLPDVGFGFLRFLPASQSVTKADSIRIDLSAIAKGFAADGVGDLLLDMGITNFLVEIGGELRASGVSGLDRPWRIAIEVPGPVPGDVQRIISVTDKGIATSGDYRNYFEKDGIRYSHTIDPRNGRPISHNLASVTVVADNATVADALATAYMVLGPVEALSLANRDGVAACFLLKNQEEFVEMTSEAFAINYSGQ